MRISTFINNLSNDSYLTTTDQLLDLAKVKTTFWGKRVIIVEGFEGSLSINEIARDVLASPNEGQVENEMGKIDARHKQPAMRKLKKLYKDSDTNIQSKNRFTRIISRLREFSFNPYQERFFIDEVQD